MARTLQAGDKYLQGGPGQGPNTAAGEGLPLPACFEHSLQKTVIHIQTPSDSRDREGEGLLLDSPGKAKFLVCSVAVRSNQLMAAFQFTWCSCWGSVKVATA